MPKCEQCEKEVPYLIKYRSVKVCSPCEKALIDDEKQTRGRFDDAIVDYDFDLRAEMRDDDYDY